MTLAYDTRGPIVATFLQFGVPGIPIPQGSKRIVPTKRGVRLIDVRSTPLKEWREAIGRAARSAMGGRLPSTGHVVLECTFILPRQKSVTREFPTAKPDLDKLLRALGDALTGIAFVDDSQITNLCVRKEYETDDRVPGVIAEVHLYR